jgi:hypothetical protein
LRSFSSSKSGTDYSVDKQKLLRHFVACRLRLWLNANDYNNDGKSDILWRHDSGQVYLWEMNGLGIAAEGGAPHAPVPSDWHIFSQHNFV